jgi:hypothetical protein
MTSGILALYMMGCSMSTADHVSNALDAVTDMTASGYSAVKSICVAYEWQIVNRTGTTETEDVADLATTRAECDRVKTIFDAWFAADTLARTLLRAGEVREAIKLIPEVREYSRALLRAVKEVQNGMGRKAIEIGD